MLKKLKSWVILQGLAHLQDSKIFKPNHKIATPMKSPEHYGLTRNVFSKNIHTNDNETLKIWHKQPSDGAPTVVFFHGNKGHLGDVTELQEGEKADYRIDVLKKIEESGLGFIAVSLRGYGKSTGAPSEAGFAKDVAAVADYLERENIDPQKTILFGESLGASVALMLAEELAIRGVILVAIIMVAGFTSIRDKVLDDYPELEGMGINQKIKHRFDSVERIKNLPKSTRLCILHPTEDTTTPIKHSKELAETAQNAGLDVQYIPLAGANHITWNAEQVVQKMLEFYGK